MSGCPETPLWEELQRQAAQGGVLSIALRDASAEGVRVIEVAWPGGELETLRFRTGDDLDALAHALAEELGVPLVPRGPHGPAVDAEL